MSHMRKDYGGVVGLALFIILLASGILWALGDSAEVTPAQSWDQENLKRHDIGCPSAIFIAPNGQLQQCQQVFRFVIPSPVVAPPEYDTLEQAAIEGLKVVAAKPTAPYYEWGGVLVQLADGKFSALAANTNFSGDSVNIHGNDFGLNATPVATYHTHPCIPEHDVEFFSPEDLMEPLFFRRTIFMGDFCTGGVHEFKPGDKADAEPSHSQGLFLSKGRLVGQFTAPRALTVVE